MLCGAGESERTSGCFTAESVAASQGAVSEGTRRQVRWRCCATFGKAAFAGKEAVRYKRGNPCYADILNSRKASSSSMCSRIRRVNTFMFSSSTMLGYLNGRCWAFLKWIAATFSILANQY